MHHDDVRAPGGTPLVMSVQSGAAPLSPRLPGLVEEVEMILGGRVKRAVVIDAEGSAFEILSAFGRSVRGVAVEQALAHAEAQAAAATKVLRARAGHERAARASRATRVKQGQARFGQLQPQRAIRQPDIRQADDGAAHRIRD